VRRKTPADYDISSSKRKGKGAGSAKERRGGFCSEEEGGGGFRSGNKRNLLIDGRITNRLPARERKGKPGEMAERSIALSGPGECDADMDYLIFPKENLVLGQKKERTAW